MGRPILGPCAPSPSFSVAAPATCPGAPRARMRRCRLPTASPATPAKGGADESNRVGRPPRLLRGGDRRSGRGPRPGGSRRSQIRSSSSRSLDKDDRVALEVTGNAWQIKRIIEPHVAEVIVVSPNDTGIRGARAKTDRLDARTLARLLAAGELDPVRRRRRAARGCAGGCSAAASSSGLARGRRTRSMRC